MLNRVWLFKALLINKVFSQDLLSLTVLTKSIEVILFAKKLFGAFAQQKLCGDFILHKHLTMSLTNNVVSF